MKTYIILTVITLLALFLRLYQLEKVPVGFHIDEAAIGYNGWTISQVGKDEWWTPWPVLFKSFGDYKAPGMIYATAISQRLFGHNDWAVRFPSALAGVGSVILVYFLTKELFKSALCSLLSALLLAVSPWHLQFSRLAFEGSLALFFTLLATCLFLLAIRKNIWLLVLSMLFFALAVMSYHAEKIFVPIYLTILVVIFWRKTLTRHGLASLLIGSLFFLPYLPTYFSPEGRARAVSESIFGQKEPAIKLFQENFAASFSLDYLFFRGDQNGRHSVKKLGELYVWQLPFVIIGAYLLLRKYRLPAIIIFGWLLLAALPPALVRPSPHAYRNLIAVPMWQVITAVGLISVWKKIKFRWILAGILSLVIIHSFVVYLDWYYTHAPRMFGPDFNDGYREAALYLKSQESNYGKIAVQSSLPEIYLKFYGGELQKYQFFKNPMKYTSGTLGLMPVWMVSADNEKIIKTIKQKSGDPIFYAYKY